MKNNEPPTPPQDSFQTWLDTLDSCLLMTDGSTHELYNITTQSLKRHWKCGSSAQDVAISMNRHVALVLERMSR